MKLSFKKFQREDFTEYQSWFQDPWLNKQLGPMDKEEDEEWLELVLTARDGAQYSVFEKEVLVAVVGIVFPDDESLYYVITDLAIKPSLRRRGIGAQLLTDLLLLPTIKKEWPWRAYVSKSNLKALQFFQKQGWKILQLNEEQDEMWTVQR